MISTALMIVLEIIAVLGAGLGGFLLLTNPSPAGMMAAVAITVVPYAICSVAQRHRLLTLAHEVRNRLPVDDRG